MKQRMQGMVMGILLMALLMGTVTALAAAPRTIQATFGNVRTTLFGQEFVVRDAQGIVIEPLTYNGRVYVPVDSILHAMGENVQWDATNGVLNFGTGVPTATAGSLNQLAPLVSATGTVWADNQVTIRYNRTQTATFDDVLLFRGNRGADVSSRHNLGGRFTTLSGTLGTVDWGAGGVSLSFYGDGVLIRTFSVGIDDLIPVSIDVAGVQQLEIRFTTARSELNNATFAFAAPTLQ